MSSVAEASVTAGSAPGANGGFEYGDRDFAEIAAILRDSTGISLNDTKVTLVYSRLTKRLRLQGLSSFRDYCALIREDHTERQAMIEALTTNTTSFFRERHHFDHLRNVSLPPLIEAARSGRRVRIWSSAASSGQEAYSIAMTILALATDAASLDIRILATDINSQMVEKGQTGQFDSEELSGVPSAMGTRYFRIDKQRAVASDEIKSLISFRQLNLLDPWPMRGSFDIVFCRNVMIYFAPETQAALWQRLGAQVGTGGYLYIGHSERLSGSAASEFDLVGVTSYRKHGRG